MQLMVCSSSLKITFPPLLLVISSFVEDEEEEEKDGSNEEEMEEELELGNGALTESEEKAIETLSGMEEKSSQEYSVDMGIFLLRKQSMAAKKKGEEEKERKKAVKKRKQRERREEERKRPSSIGRRASSRINGFPTGHLDPEVLINFFTHHSSILCTL